MADYKWIQYTDLCKMKCYLYIKDIKSVLLGHNAASVDNFFSRRFETTCWSYFLR
jgi:hypothetical protein